MLAEVKAATLAGRDPSDDPALIGRLALVAAEIARAEGIAERGYRTVINTNADAGQSVFHVHGHVLVVRLANVRARLVVRAVSRRLRAGVVLL